jgi:hypothetical protein
MTSLTLSNLADLIRYGNKKSVQQAKEDIEKIIPVEITFNGTVICKLVPKSWRNPAFPIH